MAPVPSSTGCTSAREVTIFLPNVSSYIGMVVRQEEVGGAGVRRCEKV